MQAPLLCVDPSGQVPHLCPSAAAQHYPALEKYPLPRRMLLVLPQVCSWRQPEVLPCALSSAARMQAWRVFLSALLSLHPTAPSHEEPQHFAPAVMYTCGGCQPVK
jgi:hypothetical protein